MSEPRFGCKLCGRRWDGQAECHCGTCHLHFLSVTGFDTHRTGEPHERRCLAPIELLLPSEKTGKPRMVEIERMHGAVWVTETRDLSPRVDLKTGVNA